MAEEQKQGSCGISKLKQKVIRQIPESAIHKDGNQYGRRVEANRTWTVYHVFTGVPVLHDSYPMTGLSQSEATEGMLTLNRREMERLRECVALTRLTPNAPEAACRR